MIITDSATATASSSEAPREGRLRADVRRSRRKRPGALTLLTVVVAVAGASVLAYSPAAQWLADYNQSLIIDDYPRSVADADPGPADQLAQARDYNAALSSGAVLAAGTNVPTSTAVAGDGFDYDALLLTDSGVMARIQIPSIDVDLPIYHGTSDETLRRGAGHLQGTSLPVGGESTRSVITAHRGLPEAMMFTDLDRVEVGDLFTVTTFGEVLTYRVVDTAVVDPADTATLRQEAGRDLVTLVTCTPLGINTHRILVTGEREDPAPPAAQDAAARSPGGPGVPWWALGYAAALLFVGAYARWASTPVPRTAGPRDALPASHTAC